VIRRFFVPRACCAGFARRRGGAAVFAIGSAIAAMPIMNKSKRLLVLGGGIFALCAGVTVAQTVPPPARKLPAPQHVTAQTQQEIKARMAQHGATMESLVRAVVLQDRPTIKVMANRIADEEVVARTSGIREKRPPVLPPGFFTAQDELAAAARQIAVAAAAGGDDARLAGGFAALTRTCVSCHGAYVHDRPAPWPAQPKLKSEPAPSPPAGR
jgi:hypothetical protein